MTPNTLFEFDQGEVVLTKDGRRGMVSGREYARQKGKPKEPASACYKLRYCSGTGETMGWFQGRKLRKESV